MSVELDIQKICDRMGRRLGDMSVQLAIKEEECDALHTEVARLNLELSKYIQPIESTEKS